MYIGLTWIYALPTTIQTQVVFITFVGPFLPSTYSWNQGWFQTWHSTTYQELRLESSKYIWLFQRYVTVPWSLLMRNRTSGSVGYCYWTSWQRLWVHYTIMTFSEIFTRFWLQENMFLYIHKQQNKGQGAVAAPTFLEEGQNPPPPPPHTHTLYNVNYVTY